MSGNFPVSQDVRRLGDLHGKCSYLGVSNAFVLFVLRFRVMVQNSVRDTTCKLAQLIQSKQNSASVSLSDIRTMK